MNLGVLEEDPFSTTGVIAIMRHLHNFVHMHIRDDRSAVHIIPCNGDQLSVERMHHAKRARLPWGDSVERLDGLLETPQEFHKEGILLQV